MVDLVLKVDGTTGKQKASAFPNTFPSIIIGDGTDGSWKITVVGNDLTFQRMESSVWVNKGGATA